jgi:hypothetical protein
LLVLAKLNQRFPFWRTDDFLNGLASLALGQMSYHFTVAVEPVLEPKELLALALLERWVGEGI